MICSVRPRNGMWQLPIRVSASLRSDGGALCPIEAVATGGLCGNGNRVAVCGGVCFVLLGRDGGEVVIGSCYLSSFVCT